MKSRAAPSGAGLPANVPARRRSGRRGAVRPQSILLGTSSVVLVFVLWDLAVRWEIVDPSYVPPPLTVGEALIGFTGDPVFWNAVAVTGTEFILGLGISIVLGGVLGVLCGWYVPVDDFFKPLVVAVNAMPNVAIVPIVIIIFGIGIEPKVVIVVLACTVTMLMNTAAGVKEVDKQLMRMSRSLGATDWQAIRTVVLPSVVPYFMAGLRISVGRALVAVIVAEFFASQAGLGNMLIRASNSFNMPVVFALVIVMIILGLILTQGAQWLENRMQRWKT